MKILSKELRNLSGKTVCHCHL